MNTINKLISTTIFILLFTICYPTFSQTYQIKSLDDKIVKVNLNYKMYSKKLAVSCSTDTVYLLDYTGNQAVNVLKGRFIQIQYDVLGGIGIINRNTLILSVYQNKIVTSLLINSHFEGSSPDRGIYYDVKLKYKADSGNKFRMIASVIDKKKSKNEPLSNIASTENVNLNFDQNRKVFYSKLEYLSQYFKVFNPDDSGNATEVAVKGKMPAILLGKTHRYLYVNDCWYAQGNLIAKSNNLVPYSFRRKIN